MSPVALGFSLICMGSIGLISLTSSHLYRKEPLMTSELMLSLIAILFTISVYTYNVALGLEKAAVVGLFRNAAYPLAALIGAFLFRQKISAHEWLSLSFIVAAVFFGAV